MNKQAKYTVEVSRPRKARESVPCETWGQALGVMLSRLYRWIESYPGELCQVVINENSVRATVWQADYIINYESKIIES